LPDIDPAYVQVGAVVLGALVLGLIFRAKRLHLLQFLLVLSLVAGCAYYFTAQHPLLSMLPQGLDLQGGTRLVLEAVPSVPKGEWDDRAMHLTHRQWLRDHIAERRVSPERLETTVGVIRERVDRLGVAEPVIYQVPGKDRIVVELAAVSRQEAMDIVQIAYLTFVDAEGNVIVTGDDLIRAQERLDRNTQAGTQAIIHLELTPEAQRRFAEATTRIYNGQSASRQIYIYLDEDLVQAPLVQSPNIADPIIQGYASLEEAHRIATILNIGALPVQLEVTEVREVSASLGAESIQRSQVAAAIGIAAVALFMILFYRGAGLVADFALVVYGLIVMAALYLTGAVLTLPGVAGLVLGVGIAVDANVIIFERIKDHLRLGRTLRAAVESGFRSAMRTVIDANVTTLIAAAVLFYFGTGPVRGFAVTLSVSILASMLTAVLFSQFMLRLIVNSRLVRSAAVLFGEREAKLNAAR